MSLLHRRSAALLALLVPFALHAQKKALTQADWDRWRSIQSPTLSNDGTWAAYRLAPQVGDGELVVRSTSGPTEYRIPLGYVSRPNNTPGGARRGGGAAGGGRGRGGGGGGGSTGPFTTDTRWVLDNHPTEQGSRRQGRCSPARSQHGGPGQRRGWNRSGHQQSDVAGAALPRRRQDDHARECPVIPPAAGECRLVDLRTG